MFGRVVGKALFLVISVSVLFGSLAAYAQAPRLPADPPKSVQAAPAVAAVVYRQPPATTGGFWLSSLRDPDGSASDQWAWDGFQLSWTQGITELQWRGGYDPARFGSGGPVNGFTIEIYTSIASGVQPDLTQPPLVHYELVGNAGETAAGMLGGVQTYDYHYVLPAPFQAAAETKYWIQIEALQSGAPDWGLAKATEGDGYYYRRLQGDGFDYQIALGDTAFTLLGPVAVSGPYQVSLPLIMKH